MFFTGVFCPGEESPTPGILEGHIQGCLRTLSLFQFCEGCPESSWQTVLFLPRAVGCPESQAEEGSAPCGLCPESGCPQTARTKEDSVWSAESRAG